MGASSQSSYNRQLTRSYSLASQTDNQDSAHSGKKEKATRANSKVSIQLEDQADHHEPAHHGRAERPKDLAGRFSRSSSALKRLRNVPTALRLGQSGGAPRARLSVGTALAATRLLKATRQQRAEACEPNRAAQRLQRAVHARKLLPPKPACAPSRRLKNLLLQHGGLSRDPATSTKAQSTQSKLTRLSDPKKPLASESQSDGNRILATPAAAGPDSTPPKGPKIVNIQPAEDEAAQATRGADSTRGLRLRFIRNPTQIMMIKP